MDRLASTLSALAGLLALALLTPSCLRVSWERVELERPIAPEAHAELRPLDCDLTRCLEQLGAPLYVWEEKDRDVALAWGWRSDRAWGVNLSIPLTQELGTTLDFQTAKESLHGLVLVFDSRNQLIEKRVGFLGEIARGQGRRRPASVEED